MTPYYDEDGVTIWHADCRHVLPGLAADAVVTDPPYGTGHYATDGAVFTPDLLQTLAAIGPCAVFGWPERLVAICIAALLAPTEWVTWAPTNGACRGFNLHGLWRDSESIAIFGGAGWKDLRRTRSESSSRLMEAAYAPLVESRSGCRTKGADLARLGDVWTDPAPGLAFQSRQRLHPNEKPAGIMRRLVEGASREGQVVLDPFMGSGTTLRAAKDAGRRAIGVEIDERYCEIAAKRLAQGVLALGPSRPTDGRNAR